MIYLETERLILRDYQEDDFSEYYRLKADSKTMYYLQDIQMHTKEDAYEDFCMVLEDMKKPDRKFYFMHIELKDSHEQVGSIGYTVTSNTPIGKIVHAGYFIYPKLPPPQSQSITRSIITSTTDININKTHFL